MSSPETSTGRALFRASIIRRRPRSRIAEPGIASRRGGGYVSLSPDVLGVDPAAGAGLWIDNIRFAAVGRRLRLDVRCEVRRWWSATVKESGGGRLFDASRGGQRAMKKQGPARGAGVSMHERILHDVEHKIASGAWPPGHQVPYEIDLAAEVRRLANDHEQGDVVPVLARPHRSPPTCRHVRLHAANRTVGPEDSGLRARGGADGRALSLSVAENFGVARLKRHACDKPPRLLCRQAHSGAAGTASYRRCSRGAGGARDQSRRRPAGARAEI